RNLHFQGEWKKINIVIRWFLLLFPVVVVVYGYNNGEYDLNELLNNEAIPVWLLWLGIIAQVLFTLRFVYQWIYSERTKTSQLPIGFWRLSVLGASLILTYAIFRMDPVLFVGHGAGTIIYVRNIIIGKKERNEVA
ncbi:MAG: lipid-A-disaccharide synthase N-terminal domain-containing protein, partial [Bacteroidota bacterium]